MATVDTSIYARNPLRTVTDYENELRQAELQKQGLAQNKLALETGRLKMDEYQRGVQRQNALQGILGGLGSDPEANTQALLKGGFMKEATDYQKAQVEATKAAAERLDKKIAQHTSLLSQVQNPQMAVQWMQAAYQDPDLGKIMSRLGPPEEAAKSIPQDPQGFQNWLLQASAGADKLRAQLAEEARDAETRANNLRTDTRVKSEGAANRAVQMRGQNLTDARSREANAAGKPPPGYRFKQDGSLEAIPGGPADIKAGEAGAKAEARKQSAAAQANNVLDIIREAKNLVGVSTAGPGALLAKLPATDARNLASKLETVKANLGFDRLQQMREQSPTGGALGAVAVQELMALQSTVASLDQAQSPKQLKDALEKIERHYSKWLETVGGQRQPSGASGEWSIEPAQ